MTGMRDDRGAADDVLLRVLAEIRGKVAPAPVYARLLAGHDSPVSPRLVATALRSRLTGLVGALTGTGWTPSDLGHVVRRDLDVHHVPVLAALLEAEVARHGRHRVDATWLDELASLKVQRPADLRVVGDLGLALGLASTLVVLPPIEQVLPAPGAVRPSAARGRVPDVTPGAVPVGERDVARLAKIRALLAKAESTEFPEEAEALSAKAQELVSRYSLERLVAHAADPDDGVEVRVRRIWIDQPYVYPKALLVNAVAKANRCRTVIAERLGFSTVIGDADDLDAAELIVTSLLVQASTAMLVHGRDQGRRGESRTTSFRRAFLMAYAGRIGERLGAAADEATQESGRSAELVPIIAKHAEQVDATVDQLFPTLRTRRATVSNGAGWAAGRAAADRATLSPRNLTAGGA